MSLEEIKILLQGGNLVLLFYVLKRVFNLGDRMLEIEAERKSGKPGKEAK